MPIYAHRFLHPLPTPPADDTADDLPADVDDAIDEHNTRDWPGDWRRTDRHPLDGGDAA